jgi:pimeloyl-ACP methyl ester carboxylesterase
MTNKIEKYTLQGVEVEVARKGAGAPFLLLHGGGGSVIDQPFTDELAKQFEVIAPVHPGFNGSKVPDHFDGMDDLKYLYFDLLDTFDINDATMMGISMGGWLAAELASTSCARFSKLILVDAVGVKIGGPTDRDIADVFGLPPEEVNRLMWHDPSNARDLSGLPDEAVAAVAANRIALGLYTWEPYMHNPKLRHRLHRISVPTLLIWGESDQLVTPDYGKAYAELIPGAKFVAIPEAGHSPYAEQTDAFVSHVLAFTD